MTNKRLKIKVCGMRMQENINELAALAVDMIGLIFYEPSKRYVLAQSPPSVEFLENLPQKLVGVFVNAAIPSLLEKVGEYSLDYIQLHGTESPEYCQNIKSVWPNIQIIKAFAVGADFDFHQTKAYEPFCQLFLFDTKGKNYGGNGVKFDWKILNQYEGMRPFLLSGGIGPDDAAAVNAVNHHLLYGVDLNSGFEDEPGLKNTVKLNEFIGHIHVNNNP